MCIWLKGRLKLVGVDRFFNKAKCLPFGVGAQFGVALRRASTLVPHKGTYGVQRNILACQPRAERVPQSVKNHFEPPVSDARVKAENTDSFVKGRSYPIAVYRLSVPRIKQKRFLGGGKDTLKKPDYGIVHVGCAFSCFAIDINELVVEVQVLSAELQNFPCTHPRMHGNHGYTIDPARQYLEQIEQPFDLFGSEEALPCVFDPKKFDLGYRTSGEPPFDHLAEYVRHCEKDMVDTGRGKNFVGIISFQRFSLGTQQGGFEVFKIEKSDLAQGRIVKKRADVAGMMAKICGLIFEVWEMSFFEYVPCLPICHIQGFRGREYIRMSLAAYPISSDFACQYSRVAFTSPAYFFPYQLSINFISDVKAYIRLALIASGCACANVHASVSGFFTGSHFRLPPANRYAQMLTVELTTGAYSSKPYKHSRPFKIESYAMQGHEGTGRECYYVEGTMRK